MESLLLVYLLVRLSVTSEIDRIILPRLQRLSGPTASIAQKSCVAFTPSEYVFIKWFLQQTSMVLIFSTSETRLKFIFYSILSINTKKAQWTQQEIKSGLSQHLSEILVLQLLCIEMILKAIKMTTIKFFSAGFMSKSYLLLIPKSYLLYGYSELWWILVLMMHFCFFFLLIYRTNTGHIFES